MSQGTALSTDDVRAMIDEYVDRPETLSKEQRKRIREGFEAKNYSATQKEAKEILANISQLDRGLHEALSAHSPHESCQISLIRDELLRRYEAGMLFTRPLKKVTVGASA